MKPNLLNRMNIANDATRRFERKFYFPEGAGKFLNGRMIPPIGYEFVEAWSCDDLRVRAFHLVHECTRKPVFDWPDAGEPTSPAREQGGGA